MSENFEVKKGISTLEDGSKSMDVGKRLTLDEMNILKELAHAEDVQAVLDSYDLEIATIEEQL